MEPDLISKELIPLFQDLTQDGKSKPFSSLHTTGTISNVLHMAPTSHLVLQAWLEI